MDAGTRLEAGTRRRAMASAATIQIVIAHGDKPDQSLHSIIVVHPTRLSFVQREYDSCNGTRIVPVERNRWQRR